MTRPAAATRLSAAERVERFDVVIGAIDWLLANPDKMARLTLARNQQGQKVKPTDPDACSWCLTGRIARDLNYPLGLTAQQFYNEITRYLDPIGLSSGALMSANDTHPDTLPELRQRLDKTRSIWVHRQEMEDA